MNELYVNTILTDSLVNGPGRRCVVWAQGCSLHCAGCFNKSLQPFYRSDSFDVQDLADKLSSLPDDGLTISGGEPLDQNKALYRFIKIYKNLCKKSILLFSGYSYTEIKKSPAMLQTLLLTDAALCGRYTGGDIWQNKHLVIISGQIKATEITPVNNIEFSLYKGNIILTGYPNY